MDFVRTLLHSFISGSISRERIAQDDEVSVPFGKAQVLVFKKDLAPILAAYSDNRIFAQMEAVITRGRLCTGALAEVESFSEEAQSTNNWIILADYFGCFGGEGIAGRQIANAENKRDTNDDEELQSRIWKIGLQSCMDSHDSRYASRQSDLDRALVRCRRRSVH